MSAEGTRRPGFAAGGSGPGSSSTGLHSSNSGLESPSSGLSSFAAVERFLAEIRSDARRPGYVLLGDEAFLGVLCRRGVLDALVPIDLRDFCLHDLDLSTTSIFEALNLAQTPSLMAPFQVLFLRNVKTLYGRGQKKEEFAAIDEYFRSPNPQALVLFVADHLALPRDLRRMDMQDREKAERIRETLGEACGMVELQRVAPDEAMRWVMRSAEAQRVEFSEDAARELVDALGADMLTIASELEKLLLYATSAPMAASAATATSASVAGSLFAAEDPSAAGKQREGAASRQAPPETSMVRLGDVEEMVAAAKQRSLYELTDAISRKDAPHALALLSGLLNASEGGEDAAIGHVFSLARTFRQMLVLNEGNVKDQRGMWQVLWPGFRVAPFAADALIAQARRYRDRTELAQALKWIARADLELRSNPADKRLVLERLVLRLSGAGPMERS